MLQACVAVPAPLHERPPYAGLGLVQLLARDLDPPPHESEHEVHDDQEVYPPSTVKMILDGNDHVTPLVELKSKFYLKNKTELKYVIHTLVILDNS